MSMSELKLQSHIIEKIREQGGVGIKMSNRFQVGVPDLLLKPKYCSVIISEVKVAKFYKSRDEWQWEPTVLQRNFLKEWSAAGAITCMLVGFGDSLVDFKLLWINDLDQTKCSAKLVDSLPSKKEYTKSHQDIVNQTIKSEVLRG